MTRLIITTLFLAATLPALACSPDTPATPMPTIPPTSILTPTHLPTPTATLTPTPQPTPTPTPETTLRPPQPIPEMDVYRLPAAAYKSPSIDQQILDSDVIVVASLVSVTAGVQTIPGKPGVAPTYRPMQTLSFRATEYLKGTGPAEFSVEVLDSSRSIHTHGDLYEGYLTEAEAMTAATGLVAQRNTTWDNRPGVIFLKGPLTSVAQSSDGSSGVSSDGVYEFSLSNQGAQTNFQYAIDTLSRTWLPAKEAISSESSVVSSTEYITDETKNPPLVTTISTLKTRIREIDALLNAGDGSEAYADCVYDSLVAERYYRNEVPPTWEISIGSGLASGTALYESSKEYDPKYNVHSVSGLDSELFQALLRDDDKDASNGYYYDNVTTRPLPAGKFTFNYHMQHYSNVICNFNPTHINYITHNVRVTASSGTLHEAFFDPVESGEDEVSPASFSVGGTDTEITGLEWTDGNVTLTLNPHISLSGYTLDFIALDGSIPLSLPADNAVSNPDAATLAWPVPHQPWRPGDKLMLRIREDSAPPPPTPTP